MQRSPQFVVLSVDTGSSVKQDLHHVLIVVYTTLETEENNVNFDLCEIHNDIGVTFPAIKGVKREKKD